MVVTYASLIADLRDMGIGSSLAKESEYVGCERGKQTYAAAQIDQVQSPWRHKRVETFVKTISGLIKEAEARFQDR